MDESIVLEERPEKSVSSDLIRGHINTIILRALYDGDKYGYEIIAEIERKSHGQYSLKQPSLYSALKRLEKDGYVTSYWGGSVSGGRRKYFSLTESGKAISEQNQSEWEYSRTVIDSLISDKDFDFSNPAPTAVNMRVLKETTSRVPRSEWSDDELDYEPSFNDTEELAKLEARYKEQLKELEEKRGELERSRTAFEEEIRARSEAADKERAWRESEIIAREQALAQKRAELETLRAQQTQSQALETAAQTEALAQLEARYRDQLKELDEKRSELEQRETAFEEEMRARNEAVIRERAWRENEIAAREQALAQKRAELEALRAQQEEQKTREENEQAEALQGKITSLEYELRESEAALENTRRQSETQAEESRIQLEEVRETERRLYDEKLTQALEEERARHAEELKLQESRIVAQQEELFRKREQQLLHRNYLDLVNAPQQEEPPHDYSYYTPPAPREENNEPAPVEDYRTVVHRLYANAVSGEPASASENKAQSLDGIDFTDLEARAAQDGIRIQTAGSTAKQAENESVSLVHKGKALFLSGIVTFLFCVALGSILLGVTPSAGLPVFYPYLIWSIGLAVLLVTGLAYANRYGERALRRTGPVILNVVVGYILLVIVTLIAALSARADLNDPVQLTSWVTIPAIAYLGVVLFGVVYYLQVRPKKD